MSRKAAGRPRVLAMDERGLHYLASSITSKQMMDDMVDHAAEVLDVPTCALHVEQANGVVIISKVSTDTSA